MNTWSGFLCVILVAGSLVGPASAQSMFHFPQVGAAGPGTLTVANVDARAAEVDFELFGLDGGTSGNALERVRYRLEAGEVFSMPVDTVFAAAGARGWIRVSSDLSGLTAELVSGDAVSNLEVIPSARPLSDQIVVMPPSNAPVARQLRIVNPSAQRVSVSVMVFDGQGTAVRTLSATVEAQAIFDSDLAALAPIPQVLAARISASGPVLAQAALGAGPSLILVNGRSVTEGAGALWIAPHVVSGNGFESTLILSNPTGQGITVFVTLFSESGGPVHISQVVPRRWALNIAPNGTISVGVTRLTGLPIAPAVNGWIQVEAPNIPLGGTLVVARGAQRTAYPLQPAARTDWTYLAGAAIDIGAGGLALINRGAAAANVEILALDPDGYVLGRSSITVGANTKWSGLVSEVLAAASLGPGGMLALRSMLPIHGVFFAETTKGLLAATGAGSHLPAREKPASLRPAILWASPEQIRPGDRVRLLVENIEGPYSVLLGGRPVDVRVLAPGIPLLEFEVPQIGAGFVDLRVRSAGDSSRPVTLLVAPSGPSAEVGGRAFYEKIDLRADGLDFNRPVMIPIRDVQVDVFSQATGQTVSSTRTDRYGAFRALVPVDGGYAVRVRSRSASSDVVVANNTAGGGTYAVSEDIPPDRPPVLIAQDAGRVSGAFNILEVIRKGNALLGGLDAGLRPPELTIFWSPANTRVLGNVEAGQIGGTFFDAGTDTAFVLGDRALDSDEFDDAVILHEYAHLLASRFSRDDSQGGPHVLGDVLDPRVAWSEGWANLFSGLVREDPIYRDSIGTGGQEIFEFDLEQNVPAGDAPGYWSEFSVHSILWDLVDDLSDAGDNTRIDAATLWRAFTGLRNGRFIYLPTFLDRLVELVPSESLGIEQIVRGRSIDYRASARPSIADPFPRLVSDDHAVTGEVDSLSRQRTNLAQSAHQYAFDVAGGAVSLRLDITGVGPGGNPGANDLDLFLMDSEGRVLALSDQGLNGQSELISTFLTAGRYVVEVRSFYTQGEPGTLIFNSGSYRLQFQLH